MQTLLKKLKDFKLSGIVSNLEQRLNYANANKLSYIDFLELLCEDEFDTRRDNNYKRRYNAAKLPLQKNLEDFDFSFQTSINEREINNLATCHFIKEKQNIVMIGNPGTGKTHLAIGIAMQALKKEYKVYFTTVSDMLYQLHISKADSSYHKKLQQIVNYDLLVLDELGFKTLPKYSTDDFFNVISKRHENKSTIITTNKNFTQWEDIFGDVSLTNAIVDRLIHFATVLDIKGISYRTKKNKILQKEGEKMG